MIRSRAGDILVTGLRPLLVPIGMKLSYPITVEGKLNNGKIIKGGTFCFTIRSGDVEDAAGNALDGTFFGSFPTGDGHPGGDFVARVDAIHNQIFTFPQPVQPTVPPPRKSAAPTQSTKATVSAAAPRVKQPVPANVFDLALAHVQGKK